MVYIIVKDKESCMRRLKGKTVAEFDRNMVEEGWPSDFASEEDRDRLAFEEKKRGRAIRREEIAVDGRLPAVKKLQEADKRGEIRNMTKKEQADMFGYIKY